MDTIVKILTEVFVWNKTTVIALFVAVGLGFFLELMQFISILFSKLDKKNKK